MEANRFVTCRQFFLGLRELYKKRALISDSLREFFICDDEIRNTLNFYFYCNHLNCRFLLDGKFYYIDFHESKGNFKVMDPSGNIKIDKSRIAQLNERIEQLRQFETCLNEIVTIYDKDDYIYSYDSFEIDSIASKIKIGGQNGSFGLNYFPMGIHNISMNELFVLWTNKPLERELLCHAFSDSLYIDMSQLNNEDDYSKAIQQFYENDYEIVVPERYDFKEGGFNTLFGVQEQGRKLVLKNIPNL